MEYIKRKIVIKATQWFKSGDHPRDDRKECIDSEGKPFLGEGEIVGYYRTHYPDRTLTCKKCGDIMRNHGWLGREASRPESTVVCPGDFIITEEGGYYPCKPDIFEATYVELGDDHG